MTKQWPASLTWGHSTVISELLRHEFAVETLDVVARELRIADIMNQFTYMAVFILKNSETGNEKVTAYIEVDCQSDDTSEWKVLYKGVYVGDTQIVEVDNRK